MHLSWADWLLWLGLVGLGWGLASSRLGGSPFGEECQALESTSAQESASVGADAGTDASTGAGKGAGPGRVLFEKFDSPIRLQGFVEAPFYWIYLGAPSIQGVAYLPSFAIRVGPRVLWKELGATVSFALPIPQDEQVRRGTSSQTEVIFNTYWHQNAMDLYYQAFGGFYVDSPFSELGGNRPPRYPQLPAAKVTNYGFNWYYQFQPEKFSLKAAFDQNEFQTESGGSWLISPFYNHLDMSLGSVFVPGISDDSVTSIPNLASGRFDTLGSSAGYGYTYILGRFFASTEAAAGPGLQIQRLNRADGAAALQYALALKINFNASMGWNFKGYVGGVKLLVDSLSSSVAGTEFASSLASAQAFFGARF